MLFIQYRKINLINLLIKKNIGKFKLLYRAKKINTNSVNQIKIKNLFLNLNLLKNLNSKSLVLKNKISKNYKLYNYLFIKIISKKNNIFVNIFLKNKKYKSLFLISFGKLKIQGKKFRRNSTALKFLCKSVSLFIKKFLITLKKRKLKYKSQIFLDFGKIYRKKSIVKNFIYN
jgi:hypothetical protein